MADWSQVVEILSAISHHSLPETTPELCKLVNKGSSDILNQSDEFEEFFSSLVALSAHFIGLYASSCKDCLPHALSACNVILKFCLSRIPKERDKFFSKKNLVSIIEGLCKSHGCLDGTEVTTFMAVLKSAKYPKTKEQQPSVSAAMPEQIGIYQQLTGTFETFADLPFLGHPLARHAILRFENEHAAIDAKSSLSNGNVATLREMQGGKVLLDLCASLPNISQFMALRGMEDLHPSMKTLNSLSVSSILSFSTSRVHDLASEINLIGSIASIPIMEPLNSYRLNKITLLALGCVDVAVYAASGNFARSGSDEGNKEAIAKQLVDSSLSVVDVISHTLATSHRAGGHILQNFHLLVSHCILKGIAPLLNAESSAELKKEKDVNKLKNLQGFNVLLVELSKKVINTLSSLFEDLKLETGSEEDEVDIAASDMTIEVQVSAWQRIKQLLNHVAFVPLLMKLFADSYSKAYALVESALLIPEKPNSGAKSASNDVDAKSENSNEDSTDSESIFGSWFEMQLQDEEEPKSTSQEQDNGSSWKSEGKLSTADLYLDMSRTILTFVSDYMLNKSQEKLISNVQKSLQPVHLEDLASLVQDLDGAKNRIENLNGYYPFCETLNHYLHILLGCGVLSENQQGILLTDLSLSPVRTEKWPLYVGPRSLSILARILLGRQEKYHGTTEGMDDSSCVAIWAKLIETLKDNALRNDDTSPDLNVEQLQLLLIVWHHFSKAQRDKILVLCMRALYDISEDGDLRDQVPLCAYRLLQIVDYILHQYSGPPKDLLMHIQYNLFKTKIGFPMAHMDDDLMMEPLVLFFQNAEGEENVYHITSSSERRGSRESKTPRFYGLRPSDTEEGELADDEVKRLLFALNEDGLNYQSFYETLITLLSAGSNCDTLMRKKIKTINLEDAKIVRCMFGMCWRLVINLPPPVSFVRDLQQNQFFKVENPKDLVAVLVRLYWSAKLCDPSNHTTVKANLMQQNVLENDASRVISNVNTRARNVCEVLKESTWYLQQILEKLTSRAETATPDGLPGLFSVITLDSVLTRVHVTLKDLPSATDANVKSAIQKLLPVVLDFIKIYQGFARFSLLFHHTELSNDVSDVALEGDQNTILQDVAIYSKVIKIGSSTLAKHPMPSITVVSGLPMSLIEMIEKWNSLGSVHEFLPLFSPEHILNEGVSTPLRFFTAVLFFHMKATSIRFAFNLDASIQHVVQSLVLLASHLLTKYPKEEGSIHTMFTKEITDAIVPLTVDASAEFVSEQTNAILESVFGSNDSEDCASSIQEYLLENCYELMFEHSSSERPALCEDILVDSLRLIESLLDRPQGRATLQHFYQDNGKFVQLLLLSANQNFSLSYVHRMLKFVCRTLEMYEKQPNDSATLSLVQSISWLSDVNPTWLGQWLSRIIVGGETDKEMTGKMADNRLLLQSIVAFLVKEQSPISSSAISALLDSMIPLGTQLLSLATDDSIVIGSKFVDFLSISSTLAGFADGCGHLKLMEAVMRWLQTCKNHLNPELIGDGKSKENSLVECTNVLLSHVADVLAVLKQTSDEDEMSAPSHGESDLVSDVESDVVDDEDESGGEESEEDTEANQLWNKLCTFTTTRKEFANQHWYHCHTCRMNDGVGVCTICAKVCHKNHDVTYAKYGSFFCDCGAKEDDSCKAIKKRSAHDSSDSAALDEKVSAVSSYRRPLQQAERKSSSAEGQNGDLEIKNSEKTSSYEFGQPVHRRALRRQLEPNKKALINVITDHDMCQTVLGLLNTLSSVCGGSEGNALIGGARKRIATALEDLHKKEKTVENNELLLVPTLGSQEGAFENVKLVCSGDQGQAIRQLLGAHVLRRVDMCCLTSAKGRRQHLAVSHEKGKITILQLSTLLKQADSSRRKLTLTRLATTQVPFTILTLTGNACNEDFLAVCGLKDCHVLTLSGSGSVVNHLALHPELETGNFIIKAIWLPGSQTELAIVTDDFVKIYDLAKDALSPLYYFVLPAGKIRDVTFIFLPSMRQMALMSSGGQMYTQFLDESSSAKSGPFYLTNIVPVEHKDLDETNGQICGGGVSIYYSHGFQLLFFSYVQGKTFAASWTENLTKIDNLFPIGIKTTNGNKTTPTVLCHWSEVPQHPGLILCQAYTTCAPIVLMVKPDHISFQEIKSASSKSKIQDVVAIRHSLSNSDQSRTTVILLCEDGSLKIYMASQEQAGFWMSPVFQPTSAVAAFKPIKQRKVKKSVHKSTNSPHFPIDFFEQCQILNDVEYGGKDILLVYNVQQVKHRLMTAGMYIASTKQNSFSVTITNCNPSLVMVGIRVLVGCQAIDKAPTYLETFGRVVDVELKRNRWFDIPFTREEVLATDRTITLTLGQSHDSASVTMLDSIKVYGKTKEAFGWPDDLHDEGLPPPAPTNVPTASPFSQSNEIFTKSAPLSLREIMTANSLRTLDGFVSLVNAEGQTSNEEIVNTATSLLSSPLPHQVQEQAKILLASLHPSKMVYNNHKDEAQLTYVVGRLYDREPVVIDTKQDGACSEMDPEIFERLVVMTRAVAVNRPENLVRFTNELMEKYANDGSDESHDGSDLLPFPQQIMATFWKFYKLQPCNSSLVTVASSGMHHTEMTVFALVEILHAFIVTDNSYVPVVTELYVQMLLCPDAIVSFSCKQALIYLLRPASRRTQSALNNHEDAKTVANTTDEPAQLKTGADNNDGAQQALSVGIGESRSNRGEQGLMQQESDMPASPSPGNVPGQGLVPAPSAANRLEALLGGGFPAVYELPPDADDEAMMELAIALSLQQQGEEAALDLHHFLGEAIQNGEPVGEGEQSSSSASGHASEDEMETGAGSMDALQMRDSPQPPALSQGDLGSASDGSAESINGENQGDEPDRVDDPMESGVCATPKPDDQTAMDQFGMSKYDEDAREKLHMLNLVILDKFIEHFPTSDGVTGVQAIPFMQVLLVLCSDLDTSECHNDLLDRVLFTCIRELHLEESADLSDISSRSSSHEVQLIVMRFLSVLMSKSKSSGKSSVQPSSSMSARVSASLWQENIMDHCLEILKRLMEHWKVLEKREEGEGSVSGRLLKPQPNHSPPDMSPFFLRQYVKSHASDVFEAYPLLVTEMVLRLSYQVKKIADSAMEGEAQKKDLRYEWFTCLFEYMMIQQSSFVKIKRQVRKLLLFLCGSKENYREQRDSHALDVHFKAVRDICRRSGFSQAHTTLGPISIEYDTLLLLIEHLKAAAEIASSRTKNWQTYCLNNKHTLPFLFKVSFLIDEGVTGAILQLLTTALCENGGDPSVAVKEKPKMTDEENNKSVLYVLVGQLNEFVDIDSIRQFVRCFLLQSNSSSIRWHAHALLYSIQKNSDNSQQDKLSDMMWSIWPELPGFGRKAAQFVDLLGYFTIKRSLSEEKASEFSEKAVCLLRKQNEILRNHPNSNVYRLLSGLVDFDGFYLESDPCLVCNNPEVPYSINKLSAIKSDARFSTTCQMVKLVSSYDISRVSLRISDVKRQKMVKTINLYYNNRSVQSVVELKNKTSQWQKAKKCHLIQGQTDLKIDFPLPIVACNLMIEYADFYENIQASSETLQCPRCSAAVAASPGVCGNCGENVYQCHKCRSINYDEKDPYLCNACGFCKYAKFDVTLTAKPCCAVDPIENEEDRKKAVTNINTLLERADKMYRQLVAHRQPLDNLLMKVMEQGDNDLTKSEPSQVTISPAGTTSGHTVNKTIQAVAQRYCVECKSNFDELSKIIQKVLASRKELIEYDNRVRESPLIKSAATGEEPTTPPRGKPISALSDGQSVPGRCYGCSSAATEHCVTLLKALAMKPSTRDTLIKEGLILELVNHTLYQGTSSVRNNARDLLCLLTRNNPDAADELNTILVNRVTKGIKEQTVNPSVSSCISRDMQLLTKTVEMEDCCWEQRLRCVTRVFLLSVQHVSPIVVQTVTLPCLKILSQFIKPQTPSSKANLSKSVNDIASVKGTSAPMTNMKEWIDDQPHAGYVEWEKRVSLKTPVDGSPEKKMEAQENDEKSFESKEDDLNETWLRHVMFSPSCGALRQVACSVVEAICQIPRRKRRIMDLLTSYLDGVGSAGENATEFFNLYFELMKPPQWKHYLASSGALVTIGNLITKEIDHLTMLEEITLSSDLSQGYALKRLTELMASFIEHNEIKQEFKGKLVGAVLNGYLSLRRLVVQRTKLVDQSQEVLLELLGELTSGTESETREFMSICVNTLNRYELDDLRTPVFIFERLCSIIYPEENDIGEFLLTLEKDPQQEDFLQGRMQGNPYRSTDTGMGLLMRDVKNKICTDCDLIALLEDDTGMELLVNSKIISLDLPVKEVYKKIWCPQGEAEPMKIVYRMRGLLGDATEDIVEHLDKNNEKNVDNESVYKMANVMNECGGLEALLTRLSALRDLVRGHQLLEVILKLFSFCVKVKANREYLANPSLKTLKILLDILDKVLHVEQDGPAAIASMAEQILSIIEALLQGAGETMKRVVTGHEGDESQLEMLLNIIKMPYVRSNNNILLSLMRILPFLTFGNKKSMNALIDHFSPYLDFEKFDKTHSDDELLFLECFCNIADGIENNESGNQLKDIIIDKGIVQQAVSYLELRTPLKTFSASNLSDTDLWKDFLARPSLPYILRFLSGMCKGHARSQLSVSESTVPVIHRLEQVSSEEKIGSLAENLMEALKEHPEAKTKVTAVRRETREEKKKLAMAMRQKQLGALGMSATAGGKIITKASAAIQGFEEISNETGLTCCICREGYKYHPNKVLGIYTYTKRCLLDGYETKQRKTQGYSTVSHFNIVHYECHVAAIRLARGRDEWESAALQNSNTKCNGLLPIWGPKVSESAFASCLARHNNYIQECTGHLEPNFHNTVHDLRLLLQRFAYEKPFNEDSGGGGRQSNFNMIPYMVHMALYVMNTARLRSREEKSVNTFVEESPEIWVQSCFDVNGPLFMTVLSLFTYSLEEWKKNRLPFLNRLIILAHARHDAPKGTQKISDTVVKPYDVYKPVVVFFALVNKLHGLLKQSVSATSTNWSQDIAIYIRNNDEEILKSCEELLSFYENDILPVTSFPEFCDAAGLLAEIENSKDFIEELLTSLPS